MIRRATVNDLSSVFKIHSYCFPGTLTTSLGYLWDGAILKDYYREFLTNSPELFIVAENETGEIVGYCMGYKMEDKGIEYHIIRHHPIRIIVGIVYLLLRGDKECWRKLKSFLGIRNNTDNELITFAPEINQIQNTEKAELYTIGLHGDYRGLSYGKDLIMAYFDACKSIGRKFCIISYMKENVRAERFYYKHGCKAYQEIGDSKLCYKEL